MHVNNFATLKVIVIEMNYHEFSTSDRWEELFFGNFIIFPENILFLFLFLFFLHLIFTIIHSLFFHSFHYFHGLIIIVQKFVKKVIFVVFLIILLILFLLNRILLSIELCLHFFLIHLFQLLLSFLELILNSQVHGLGKC